MGRKSKAAAKRQGTVQVCGFALEAHRQTAISLTENKKVVATAAVLAFGRLPRAEQIKLCTEVRETLAGTPAGA